MFRFLLRLPDGEPNDPAVFVTAAPNWTVGETFLLSHEERMCIVAIETEIAEELIEQGIDGLFTVEPVSPRL